MGIQGRDALQKQLCHRLVVSCQALENEPLHDPYIMARMARAAEEGGAAGIRANSPEQIAKIRETVDLPVIGLYKVEYPDSGVYITPTMKEVDALAAVGVDILAMDATDRPRPGGGTLEDLVAAVREKYPALPLMADTSCYDEAARAEKLGFDFVGTTLAGYTPRTKGRTLPAFDLIERCAKTLSVPVIAEGGIWTPGQLRRAMDMGAFAAVVGTAITRPREITRHFLAGLA